MKHRTSTGDPAPKVISDDEGLDLELPTVWAICGTCSGRGQTSLRVDGHGITSDEWERDWDEDSRETYLRGGYDSPCDECSGSGKVAEVDEERLTPGQLLMWREWLKDEAEYRAQVAMERRMGA